MVKKKEIVVKSAPKAFSIKARIRSFGFAFAGLNAFLQTQHNAVIHLIMTLIAMFASFMFHLSKTEAIAVIFSVAFVWVAELFNTAVEKMADMITEDFSPSVKFIKDVSAGAVLVAAIAAVLTGTIVFLPKLWP